jgi:multidrug efflux pump subunit AcrB
VEGDPTLMQYAAKGLRSDFRRRPQESPMSLDNMLTFSKDKVVLNYKFQSINEQSIPQSLTDIPASNVEDLRLACECWARLQAYLSGLYVNDFVKFGRVYKVFLQAEPEFTNTPDDIGKFWVRNNEGAMVPLATLVTVDKISGPNFATRFNLYPSAEMMGAPAPGYSSAQALKAMEEVMAGMPSNLGYEWSGLTLQEKKSEGQAPLIFGMAVLFVFLLLAAQYESWSLPFAVLLSVPTVILGTLIGLLLRNFEMNVYAQVGLVMLIGLAAKNAILIVEFAKMKRDEGMPTLEAALQGAKLRLRPILMTSFAFILGCVPLMLASGSGAASRATMGTGGYPPNVGSPEQVCQSQGGECSPVPSGASN